MGPITVTQPGTNIQTASGTDLIMNSNIPFTKLDTRNLVSFQTISVLFNNEPTQPPATGGAPTYAQTLIYQFAHGYNYIPSIWMTWENPVPSISQAFPPPGQSATNYYAFGDDTQGFAYLTVLNQSNYFNLGYLAQLQYTVVGGGTVTATTADLVVTVDKTNVYLYILKTSSLQVSNAVIPILIAGITLNIRCYVFAEPASTSTY